MKQLRLRYLLLLLLSVCTARLGWAQGVTTSAMTGIITDQTGAGLPGATVIAVHTPTNTQYVAPTNAEGRFNLQNMRVGGPYNVRVTFIGYQEAVRNNITLTLGQVLRLDVNLSEATTQLANVVVTGEDSRSVLSGGRAGSVTNVSTEEIQRLPTITRSLNDFTRLTPQASSTNAGSIGGGNFRQNNITIDGSDFNNNFGIGGNLPAGGNPISLDAVSEITVNVTPFDVRQSGFIGSAVNAVTRSGTNDFSGSVYTFWRGDKEQGNKVGDQTFTKQPLEEKQYGFRFGGPIIKDKLFFFVNAEKLDRTSPGQQNVASTDAAPFGGANTPSNVNRPTAAFLDEVSTYLRDTYDYETGAYQGYSFKSDRTTLLGRLDWNINNNNRFTVRYNQVESKSPSFVSGSRSPFGNFAFGANARTSNQALAFQNSNYYNEQNFYSLAAEFNSTLGGRFFNTLRGTFTNQNDPRSSDSQVFPFVDILDGGAGTTGNPLTSFGYEPFTFGNLREVKTYSVVDFVNFTLGAHNLTVGGQFDLQNTRNGFQRFATSYYTFSSWEDFKNGAKPRDFGLTYSLLPGFAQAFPRFKTAQYSLYAQDEYNVNDKLRLTAGLRLELNSYLNVQEVQTNPLLANLTFADGEQIDTGVLPKNRVLWSPRFGFNYDVKGDRSLQVRGGSGIFAGRVPTVWIVAQSGDAGMIQFNQINEGQANTPGPFNPDPNFYRPDVVPAAGTQIPGTVSSTARDFKNPQTWKSSLAVDAQLPFGIVGTLEGIYNKDLTIALGRNPNLVESQPLNVAGYPDNRPIYPALVRDRFINPLTDSRATAAQGGPNTPKANGDPLGTQALNTVVLSNAHKGYYWSGMAKLEKRFKEGLFASVAYVRSEQRVLFDGGGDQLLNTWSNTQIVNDSNNPELSYSSFVVPHRLIGSLSYSKEYFKHLGTTISLFYEGSIQDRFSYVYGGDFNRDGQTSNDLIYIPKDGTEIDFSNFNYGSATSPNNVSAAQQEDLFFQYIDQDDYLRSRKGQYAERNGAKLPWRHQVDIKFAQDLFADLGGKRNTLQFSIDIFNAGNLLNRNWGVRQMVNTSSILVPTNTAALTPEGTVRPTFRLATDRGQPVTSTFRDVNTLGSTYFMQFGLRYIFN